MLLEVLPWVGAMTADERSAQILAMLDALSQCKPRDMEELTLWTDGDTTGRGTCEPCPTFSNKEER